MEWAGAGAAGRDGAGERGRPDWAWAGVVAVGFRV